MTRLSFLFTAVLALLPATALAQATPQASGPLVLERMPAGWVAAPDYEITRLDGTTAHLAGGHAGIVTGDTVFIGGGAWTVTNRADDFGLTYGGLLVGWMLPPERRVQFGVRGLAGVGRATLGETITLLADGRDGRTGRVVSRTPAARDVRLIVRDDVFVFEPQLTFGAKLTRHVGVTFGAGYRVTGMTDLLGDRVNGATASAGITFGSW
jgi:hypothetical protein